MAAAPIAAIAKGSAKDRASQEAIAAWTARP
jgi:hypothetical protein